PDVLDEVLRDALAPYGREISLEMSESHPVRDYLVQYQETDLDFAHRLMEEAGISYAFDHQGDVESMVLRDASGTYPDLDPKTIAYEPHVHEAADAENVFELRRRLRRTIGRSSARGWQPASMQRVD